MRHPVVKHSPQRTFAAAVAAIIVLASLILAPAVLARGRLAVASTQPSQAGPHGTLTVVTDGSAADLDPASDELASSDMIARNIDDTLVTFTGSRIDTVRPVLATSWQVKKGGAVYVFHLRHGVRFHTGREMTATDVQYSLARTITAGLTNTYLLSRFITRPTRQIRVLDRYTVEFDLGRPQKFFLLALADEYGCLILDATALKAHIVKKDSAHAWASTHDAGTGPYMLQSWRHTQQVVLKAFPRYWGGWRGAHFDRVVVNTVPESSTRRELVEKGQANLTFQLTPQDYQAMSHDARVQLKSQTATEIDYVVMTQAGALASPYARQAMSYAFNYDATINSSLRGYGRRAYGPIPSVMLGYDPHAFHYQTDLNRARALLSRAHIKPGTTLTYAYSPGPVNESAGRILQAQLAQIGLNLKLQQLDEATFNGIFYGSEPANKRPNFMPFAWWPDYNDPYDMTNILIGSASAGANGANAGYYHNAQVDTLLSRMKTANLPTILKDARTLQDITGRQDPPAIWLAEPAEVTVMSRDLKGFVFNPLSIQTYDFYQLHT